MPMKLSVGVTKKVGLPEYSSVGASCSVEVELDPNLLQNDLDGFHERVRTAYVACQQAVLEELTRLRPVTAREHFPQRNGHAAGLEPPRSNRERPDQPATPGQLKAIAAIAKPRHEDLARRLRDEFGVDRPEDLSLREASRLIDRLKADPAA